MAKINSKNTQIMKLMDKAKQFLESGEDKNLILTLNKILHKEPKNTEALYYYGTAYLRRGEWEKALDYLTKAHETAPQNMSIIENLGILYQEQKDYEKGLYFLKLAYENDPHHMNKKTNYASALRSTGHIEKSEELCHEILKVNPDNTIALYNLAEISVSKRQEDQAINLYRKLLRIEAQNKLAIYNLSINLLRKGLYEEGFKLYEQRLNYDRLKRSRKQMPYGEAWQDKLWNGRNLGKGRLLIFTEQGIGDEIAYSKFLNSLKNKTANITLSLDKRMVPILARSFPWIESVAHDDLFNSKGQLKRNYAAVCPLGSLAFLVHKLRGNDDILNSPTAGYIKADPDAKKTLRERLKKRFPNRLLIGISWHTVNEDQGLRSISIEALTNAFDKSKVAFINLQYWKEAGKFEPHIINSGLNGAHIPSIIPEENMDDVTALIAAMDGVVTIANSNLDIAGGLGIPALGLLATNYSWICGFANAEINPYGLRESRWYETVSYIYKGDYADDYNLQNWDGTLHKLKEVLPRWLEQIDCEKSQLSLDKGAEYYKQLWQDILALFREDKMLEALPHLNELIAARPQMANAYVYRATIYQQITDEPDLSLADFKNAVEIEPQNANFWYNFGLLRGLAGDFNRSLECYKRMLALEPDNIIPAYFISTCQLGMGDYKNGWKNYESRFAYIEKVSNHTGRPDLQSWDGQARPDQTLLVQSEQGIGDQIMFFPSMMFLKDKARKVYLTCDKRLHPLLKRSHGWIEFLDHKEVVSGNFSFEDYDHTIPMGSLPMRIGLFDSIKRNWHSFLKPKLCLAHNLRARLEKQAKGRRIVGLTWYSSNLEKNDQENISPDYWHSILKNKGILFVNLQHGDEAQGLQDCALNAGAEMAWYENPDPMLDFDGFSGLVSAVDLVISIPNSTVHLAGALGVPTWLLLSKSPEWRWSYSGEKTIWYDSIRIFRQKIKWVDYFRAVGQELQDWVKSDLSPHLLLRYHLTPEEIALRLKRGEELMALEKYKKAYDIIEDSSHDTRSIINLKFICLGRLHRFDDVMLLLQEVIDEGKDIREDAKFYLYLASEIIEYSEEIGKFFLNSALRYAHHEHQNAQYNSYEVASILWLRIGEYELALKYANKGLAIETAKYDKGKLLINKATTQLKFRNFDEGWDGYENRFQNYPCSLYDFANPRWEGQSLKDKTLLINCEQGVGDQLMFASGLPFIEPLVGTNVTITCWEQLVPIFERSFPWAAVRAHRDIPLKKLDPESFDYAMPIGSLLNCLDFGKQVFLDGEAWFKPDLNARNFYRKTLKEKYPNCLLIGFSWFAHPTDDVVDRTVPLIEWLPILKDKKIVFINLESGEVAEEFNNFCREHDINCFHATTPDPRKNLSEAIDLIAALDGVITCDNSTSHMAGVVGVPCFTLLGEMYDWRWFMNSRVCQWYGSMRLFRKNKKSWTELIEEVKIEFSSWVAFNLTEKKNFDEEFNNLQAIDHNFSQPETMGRLECLQDYFGFNQLIVKSMVKHCFQQNKSLDGVILAERLIAHNPSSAWAWMMRGMGFMYLEKNEEAEESFKKALEIDPDMEIIYGNMITFYLNNHQVEEARSLLDTALQKIPNRRTLDFHKAHLLLLEYKFELVEESLLQLRYEYDDRYDATASTIYRFLVQRRGSEALGWELHEERKHDDEQYIWPESWQGEATKKLLIYEEQGIGDIIYFLRYFKSAYEKCDHITLVADSRFKNVLRRSFPAISWVNSKTFSDQQITSYNHTCYIGSLPYLLKEDGRKQAAKDGWLITDLKQRNRIRRELIRATGKKQFIGISWSGIERFPIGNRSIAIEGFKQIFTDFAYADISFIPLQHDNEYELFHTAFDCGVSSHYLPKIYYEDIDQLSALIDVMDYSIVIDGGAAHICAGLNKQATVIVNPFNHWYWGNKGRKSPFASQIKIARAKKYNQWEDALKLTSKDLKQIVTI